MDGLSAIGSDLILTAQRAHEAAAPLRHNAEAAAGAASAVAASGATDSGEPELSGPAVRALVDSMNRAPIIVNSGVRFSVNAESGRLAIRVIDAASDETIREIPPPELQKAWERLEQFHKAAGLIVDERK